MKKVILAAAILSVTVMFILYPQNCLESARNGLNLWFMIVLPSLLPFMTASFMLLETGVVKLISVFFAPVTRLLFSAPGESAYVFLASAISGYPVGAKLAGELYLKGQIAEDDAQRIIRFTSMSGPVFITGAVSTGMLGMPDAGIYLLFSHYMSALLTGILFGFLSSKKCSEYNHLKLKDAVEQFKTYNAYSRPFGEILSGSLENALFTLLKVGGYIIVFSVVMEVLKLTGAFDAAVWIYSPVSKVTGLSADTTKAILAGGIEFTNGCSAAAALNTAAVQKLCVISSIIAFGGLCVHMQTKAVLSPAGIKPRFFVIAKSIQSVLAYLSCYIMLKFFPLPMYGGSVQTKTASLIYPAIAVIILSLLIITVKLIIRRRGLNFTFGRKL